MPINKTKANKLLSQARRTKTEPSIRDPNKPRESPNNLSHTCPFSPYDWSLNQRNVFIEALSSGLCIARPQKRNTNERYITQRLYRFPTAENPPV